MFKKLFNKIKSELVKLYNKIFNKEKETPVVEEPTPELPVPNPEPVPEVPIPQPEPPKPNPTPVPSPEGDQVSVSDPNGSITSFLWKPESDTVPKVSVVSCSGDLLRAEDVKIQIKDRNGNVIPGLVPGYNVGGVKRGNKLPNHKYGRFNFKPGLNPQQFKVHSPLEVSFTLVLNGNKTPLKVMGKDFITVTDPTLRVDLK